MRLSTVSFLAAAVSPIVVSAVPVRRGTDPGTEKVLQFANVLEQLETIFYQQALQKFQPADFQAAGFTSGNVAIEQITAIQSDEATHTATIQSVLESFNVTPLVCQFDFTSVLTSVTALIPVARTVEQVGVGAYLGAAALIGDPLILTAAASIATVEARHQTILNVLSDGTAIPQAFDIALGPQEVLAIALVFIKGACDLGVPPNAALSITNTGTVTTGTSLTFSSPAINGSTDGFFCQMLVGGAPTSISLPFNACVVPSGINGPVAIFVTPDNQPLNGNPQQRASQAVVAGPTLAFIDIKPETLGELVRPLSSAGAPPPVTQTLPPAAASSLLSGASTPTPLPNSSNNSKNGNGAPGNSGAIANGVSMIPKPAQTP